MRPTAKWGLMLAVAATTAYGCGTILNVEPDPETLPVREGGDAPGDLDASTAEGGECAPRTCADLGAQCGAAPNGCGGSIPDCGTCGLGETCGAGGANRCGDGGCDAQAACGAGQCGSISNGCGGVLTCAGCTGNSGCNHDSGLCEPCTFFETGCAATSVSKCGSTVSGNRYACSQPPANGACVYCPNPTTGKGSLYCCP